VALTKSHFAASIGLAQDLKTNLWLPRRNWAVPEPRERHKSLHLRGVDRLSETVLEAPATESWQSMKEIRTLRE
jgi:hypothetical protein